MKFSTKFLRTQRSASHRVLRRHPYINTATSHHPPEHAKENQENSQSTTGRVDCRPVPGPHLYHWTPLWSSMELCIIYHTLHSLRGSISGVMGMVLRGLSHGGGASYPQGPGGGHNDGGAQAVRYSKVQSRCCPPLSFRRSVWVWGWCLLCANHPSLLIGL